MVGSVLVFQDRYHAGKLLVPFFEQYRDRKDTLVIGLARGGVVVASVISKELSLPLNVVVPRKIGAPGNPELALGAIVENGEGVFNSSIIRLLHVTDSYLNKEIESELAKAHQRLELYQQATPRPHIQGKTVILIDDGMATGATMLASIKAMKKEGAKKVIVAVPVASSHALKLTEELADEVICLYSSEDFGSVSMYYISFYQTEDNEVLKLLKASSKREHTEKESIGNQVNKEVQIPIKDFYLLGNLRVPDQAKGIVIFAHGSGSSRLSPRNQFVAKYLNKNNLGSLLVDLLTMQEEIVDDQTREFRFDIEMLAERLVAVTDWLKNEKLTQSYKVGYFGASTGAAAALMAAAKKGNEISAVVSRGGRPDLALTSLFQVKSPTLLIVGGNDHVVIDLNHQAYEKLLCEKKIEIVPKATHLFEEEGALEQVAELAAGWFQVHFV
ncbi:MAG: phosphoribosyltransferase family protein [Parachlamydiaceae bacterium]|nr:phosphoribosyltransferase family protein [Parachlamydiaceae bacterium]